MTAPTRRFLLCAGVAGALALAPAAHAAGPPLPSTASGKAGAVAPGGSERLVARRAGRDTLLVAFRRRDGRVLRERRIRGRWSIPPVALDNATTGLSGDGRTLVLSRPTRNFPAATTRLAVVDAGQLVVRRRIVLKGFFTVDAISPDGRQVFLIQYRGDDVLNYRVRALDTRSGRLAERDVVDPRSPDEQMGGLPMTRAMSPDGRWAYTLYGGGEETFIHALDTVGRTAACIDLDMIPTDTDLSGIRLRVTPDAGAVVVRDDQRAIATVDARTFEVSEPGASSARPAPRAPSTAPPADDDGWSPSALLLAACATGLAATALVIVRRRSRRRPRARVGPTRLS
jgi:hypothetical protein